MDSVEIQINLKSLVSTNYFENPLVPMEQRNGISYVPDLNEKITLYQPTKDHEIHNDMVKS
jgi:hypothetical protein